MSEEFPLSYQQEGLWLIDQSAPEAAVFNSVATYRVRGPLDVARLDAALTGIVARHESLRTAVTAVDGVPRGRLLDPAPVTAEVIDATGMTEAEASAALARAGARPFDLGRDVLLRAAVVRLAPADHLLHLCAHHIACDGRSLAVIRGELRDAYAGLADTGGEVDAIAREHTAVQRRSFPQGSNSAAVREIVEDLADLPVEPAITADRPRPRVSTFAADFVAVDLDEPLWKAVRALAAEERCAPFSILHAVFAALSSVHGARSDVAIGTATLNRRRREADAVGLFVNLAVLRVSVARAEPFRDLVEAARGALLDALEAQHVPFELITAELGRRVALSDAQPFQIVLQTLDDTEPELELTGLEVEPVDTGAHLPLHFDLGPTLLINGDTATLRLAYRTELFDRATIEKIGRTVRAVLEAAVQDPGTPIRDLPWVSAEERELLDVWNATERPLPDVPSVADLVLRRCRERPDAPAFVQDDITITYGELCERAAAVAGTLAAVGTVPDEVVGVLAPRGADLAAVQLGIWLAGGGYLVLNPRDPGPRMRFQAEEAGVRFLLAAPELAGRAAELPVTTIPLDDLPTAAGEARARKRDGIAYVVYTSGSTGRPKGVVIEHRGVLNLVAWHERMFSTCASDIATVSSIPSFDAWTLEVWPMLAAGATLLMVGDVVPVGAELQEWLLHEGVTLTHFTTPVAETLFELPWPEGTRLRTMLTGSERLRPRDWSRLPFDVWNGYGPTESTVICSSGPVPRDLSAEAFPLVGRPLDNTFIEIVAEDGRCAPVGVPGEVYVAGAGLARRYLGDPALTTELFVERPDHRGRMRRFYRSGDIARWRPTGEIEFIGRHDDQVKIRGFRIEPKEVEAVLSRHAAVARPVVTVQTGPSGERRLMAYALLRSGHEAAEAELRAHLADRLPEYMVPPRVMVVDSLPLLANGKIDRARLLEPAVTESAGRPAASPAEDLMCGIFAEVLDMPEVRPDDNFFELGGHSLLAGRLTSRIRLAFGGDVTLLSLFQAPTPAGMVARLTTADDLPFAPVLTLRSTGDREPVVCVHPGAGVAWSYTSLLRQVPQRRPVYALQSLGLRPGDTPAPSLTDMVADYTDRIRTLSPDRPCHLVGWSFGGVLAYLVAQALPIASLTLLDVYPPTGSPLQPDDAAGHERDWLAVIMNSLGLDSVQASPFAALDEEQLGRLARVARNNARMMATFRPEPYAGDVLLVRAAPDDAERERRTDAWRDLVGGRLTVVDAPADHGHLLQSEGIAAYRPALAETWRVT
ncbi:amino acid adenylation domain-containing protein [Streptosporangium canum]|uniref:Amino acid adenylation domain-containing protein n=1 Tax=Streptosporangium canum TaxID=324952 RepID=A0A1I3N192_9ACTN|nr:non-ribosomal peptide synthetase [Streptosporangium canum]SFJ02997.1 amino acid adenylation domain-containing protein [Streptosporangium canum]